MTDPGTRQPDPDFTDLVQAEIESSLLGGKAIYTRTELADKAGIDPEHAVQLWVAMGFPVNSEPNAVMFTDADLQALQLITGLTKKKVIEQSTEVAIARTLGQSMSRLAEWQVGVVNNFIVARLAKQAAESDENGVPADPDAVRQDVRALARETVPTLEALQSYTWRRHLAAAAGRSMASADADTSNRTLAVGFADMVGYTSLTRQLDVDELTKLLEEFEHIATNIIARGRGSVIKNVGDEVMFSAQSAEDAAHIALDLQDAFAELEDVPDLRVGLAFGPVLARYGDLFGSVVNIAARLTSSARPGTVLIDTAMSDALSGDAEFYLKSLRSLRVRGFHKLRTYALRRNAK